MALHEVTWCMVVWCTQNLRRDGYSFMWHQSCWRCKYTTSVEIQKTRYKKLVIHVESHASAVSLLESGEQRYIKAIKHSGTDAVNHSGRKVWQGLAPSQSLSSSNSCGAG